MKGKLIIIVGPSASGKTELVKALLARMPHAVRLVTTTTRQPRPGEHAYYHFISREEFTKKIAEGDFFEHAEVYGNLYGTSKEALHSLLEKHEYVFGIVDVQGARTLKSKLPDARTIFVRPGSVEDIRKRIVRTRKGISAEELQKRMDTVISEMALADSFDVIVENREGAFAHTVEKILGILNEYAG